MFAPFFFLLDGYLARISSPSSSSLSLSGVFFLSRQRRCVDGGRRFSVDHLSRRWMVDTSSHRVISFALLADGCCSCSCCFGGGGGGRRPCYPASLVFHGPSTVQLYVQPSETKKKKCSTRSETTKKQQQQKQDEKTRKKQLRAASGRNSRPAEDKTR